MEYTRSHHVAGGHINLKIPLPALVWEPSPAFAEMQGDSYGQSQARSPEEPYGRGEQSNRAFHMVSGSEEDGFWRH